MSATPAKPQRQSALRQPRPEGHRPRAANTAEHHLQLASRLTPRDRWLLGMVHEHRVLTSHQITRLAFPSERSGRLRLRELCQWSVLDRFRPFVARGTAPMHYVLGPAGATVLAAAHGLDAKKDLGYRRERALGIAHSLRLAHLIGLNDLGTTLAAHTLGQPGTRLHSWWSETRCARHVGDLARPDAYLHYSTRRGELGCYLEFDLGTESLTQLARKLRDYEALARSTGHTVPLLVSLPTTRRETSARRALHHTWTHLDDPRTVPVATAHPTSNPADETWLPLETTGPRRALDQLPEAWPDLALPNPQDDEPPAPAGATALLPPPAPLPPHPHTARR